MWFHLDNSALDPLMALAAAAAGGRAAAVAGALPAARWSLVLPLVIVVTVAVIGLVPASADVYTWAALLLVPVGCCPGARVGDARGAAAGSPCWPSAGFRSPDS